MKSTVAPYETAAWCVRINCVGGNVYRLTSYPFDLVMSNSQIYKTDSGYQQSAYQATNSLAASVIDIEGVAGVLGISRDMIASGLFDGARVYIFKCNWLAPVEDAEPLSAGWFGKVRLSDERYTVECMQLVEALNESQAVTVTPGCRHTFGSPDCGKNLAPLTVTGTLTSVTSAAVFSDSTRSESAGYFSAGTIRFTSGPNAGLELIEVKTHSAGGVIETHEPFYFLPSVGDAYTLTPGCAKTRPACKTWSNILNFGGFPEVPLSSTYTQVGGRYES